MKKSDSNNSDKDLEKELKKLRKENERLKSQHQSDKAENKQLKKELKKKSRSETNLDRRTTEVAFEAVPGHRFSIQLIMLCVLIYAQTGCGLRTVVSILQIFKKVLGSPFGKTPSYTTVRNWILKLGLSVYTDNVPNLYNSLI